MKVMIKEIRIGSKYQERVYDYWITGQLQSGKIIKVFDYNYDLRDFIGKNVECLIFTPLASISKQTKGKPKKNVVKGYIINNHKINEKWQNFYNREHDIYDLKKEYISIKTEDGYFPTNLKAEDIKNIDASKEIYFKVGRYDLIAWHPIE
jgi:hypothetical protein